MCKARRNRRDPLEKCESSFLLYHLFFSNPSLLLFFVYPIYSSVDHINQTHGSDAQVRSDHDALTRSLLDTNDLLSNSELSIVLTSLLATHAMTQAFDSHKALDDRKIALGMEISEVGRILMNEGDEWRKALAGV